VDTDTAVPLALVTVVVTVPSGFVAVVVVVVEELAELPPPRPAAPDFAPPARPTAPAQCDGDNAAALGETLVMACSFLSFNDWPDAGSRPAIRVPRSSVCKHSISLDNARQIMLPDAPASAKRAGSAVCVPQRFAIDCDQLSRESAGLAPAAPLVRA